MLKKRFRRDISAKLWDYPLPALRRDIKGQSPLRGRVTGVVVQLT